MNDTLRHRGPDDCGVWVDARIGFALANRRLSIIDVSSTGHQPMTSSDGRFTLVYNGEIYNHQALRARLVSHGCSFRGSSDTEVLIEGIASWGLERMLLEINGMYAFAVWDSHKRILHLVRDRIGIKPLYYGWSGGTFLFGSELKALRAHPDFSADVDRNAVSSYLRFGYVPCPQSIYKGIYKLPPGSLLSLEGPTLERQPVCYWSIDPTIAKRDPDLPRDPEQDVDALESLLRDAVASRMVSDVPLGCFLSGGIDSTTVCAVMQDLSSNPVRSFTIGVESETRDEACFARRVAHHLGTNHTELIVTPADVMRVIPEMPSLYDEPFADSSQIPTFLVSKLARDDVAVCLSGDGGDEIFCGYNRYVFGRAVWERMRYVPGPVRRMAARCVLSVSPSTWTSVFSGIRRTLGIQWNTRGPGNKMHKLAGVLSAGSPLDMYEFLTAQWQEPDVVVLDGRETRPPWRMEGHSLHLSDYIEFMMYYDLRTYLPDDILVKVDRASMGVSLEARVPLLDHRVVEFGWTLPLGSKLRGMEGKWVLRQVLERYVPVHLTERPKAGFGLPLDEWLRGPLREWGEHLLGLKRLRQDGIFDPEPIRTVWDSHQSGERNNLPKLWTILGFQAWLDEND